MRRGIAARKAATSGLDGETDPYIRSSRFERRMGFVKKFAEQKYFLEYVYGKTIAAFRRHQGFEVLAGPVFVIPRRKNALKDMRESLCQLLREALVMLGEHAPQLAEASLVVYVVRIDGLRVHVAPLTTGPGRKTAGPPPTSKLFLLL
jgi:hypothetical protein